MRPRTLDEVRGQEKLLGEGRALRRMLEGGELQSCILWGPPGSGKTTLARLLARRADAHFVAFSAVTEGVARVREIIAEARVRRRASDRATILFCDEIHRFNRAQQDAFLPHVEEGVVILIGATTENPSFEVNRPLLSRAPVFILEPLDPPALREILEDAIEDSERGLGSLGVHADPEALDFLAHSADGDARRGLGVVEVAARIASEALDRRLTLGIAKEALQHRFAIYDKSGEEHFNLISALHKSVRGSHPDAALYWLARMIEGGEDPMYIARRLIRMATEDIGLADPQALPMAVSAWQSLHFLGQPEGELSLAEVVVYLATAPKSNRVYRAWKEARGAARESPSAPVPMNLRNAPTDAMAEWGYGEGYQYDPDLPDGISKQSFLPEGVGEPPFYRPGSFGFEREIRKRLDWWEERRRAGDENESDASG
ncbi:MAG: replication-associated recombination protein A [Gemmatimonadales bacterium]|nr:MAG: replication-associated recombination protein A [Gemmatimonadales bacterium]